MFDEAATTREVFDAAVRGHVDSVVDGYNGTVFAYGQTAAGKTHTMLGSKSNPGVLPLAVNEIMEAISRARHRAFLIRCSYIEIYKEQITDLIGKKPLEVHESKTKVRGPAARTAPRPPLAPALSTPSPHTHTHTAPHTPLPRRACTWMPARRSSPLLTTFSPAWRAARRRATWGARA